MCLIYTGHMVQRYKGFAGSVRCVQCHPSSNVVAACGLDRFVRIYDLDSKTLHHKVSWHESLC